MYHIEKGIPMPKGIRGSKYPFAEMEVGDSFRVSNEDRSRISSAIVYHSKKHGTKFATKTVDGVLRVWRIA